MISFLDALLEVFEKFHHFDIVVNNAGIHNEKNYDLTIDINLVSIRNTTNNNNNNNNSNTNTLISIYIALYHALKQLI